MSLNTYRFDYICNHATEAPIQASAQDNDIKFSAHGPFLEYSKSKDWKTKRFKSSGSNKTKGPKQDSQNRLRNKVCHIQMIIGKHRNQGTCDAVLV